MTSSVSLRSVDELGDRGRDRPEPPRRVVEHDRGDRARSLVEWREELRGAGRRDVATEPAQAGHEHELELRHDRALDAHEQVVELAVLEVILDPGAADPADPAVDDHDLAVVDVPEAAQVPTAGPARVQRPSRRPRLDRAGHAHLNPGLRQPLVELPRAALGVGSLPVDDHPHRHTVPCLRDQDLREPVAHDAGTEPELVDVDGRRRSGDIREHRRIEVAALDVERHRRGGALLELDRELAARYLRGGEDALGGRGDVSAGDDGSGHGALTLLPRPSMSVAVSSPEWISAAGGGSRITRSSETCRRWRSSVGRDRSTGVASPASTRVRASRLCSEMLTMGAGPRSCRHATRDAQVSARHADPGVDLRDRRGPHPCDRLHAAPWCGAGHRADRGGSRRRGQDPIRARDPLRLREDRAVGAARRPCSGCDRRARCALPPNPGGGSRRGDDHGVRIRSDAGRADPVRADVVPVPRGVAGRNRPGARAERRPRSSGSSGRPGVPTSAITTRRSTGRSCC